MAALGAAYTALVCWSLGRLLFRALGISLGRGEHDLLAAMAGAPLLSFSVFLLCIAGWARTPVFTAFTPLIFFAAYLFARDGRKRESLPAVPRFWKILFATVVLFYAAIYLANSLAPEHSPDGMAYHLGLVARWFRTHGFQRITTNMYADMPEGMEMLFLFAFTFGGHPAAATVHCLFLIALPFLILNCARRAGHPVAGIVAGSMVFLSPLMGVDGASAYNDAGLAAAGTATFGLAEVFRAERHRGVPFVIGLLAGFCFTVKYTGIAAVAYAVVVLGRMALPALAVAFSISAPWLLKNWIWVGNPAAPFFNRWFPNPWIHISFENAYRTYFHSYGLASFRPLFRMITVTGELGGQIGPVFLLAPVALLSLRRPFGRRCTLAALIFLLPWPGNIGARFVLPALPFIALAMAITVEAWRPLGVLLIAASALLAWPRIIDRYRAPTGGWQISSVPWKAALGITPPETFLRRQSPDYRIAEKIGQATRPGSRIWSTRALAESYLATDVLVNYESAEGEEIQDLLLTPVREEMQPLRNHRFTFAPRRVRSVAVVQHADADDIWSISEIRFFRATAEERPARVSANGFPWDLGLASDGNPVTRWRSWEGMRPGMKVEFEFAGPVELDRVEVYGSHDEERSAMTLEGIPARLEILELPALPDLRAPAVRAVAAHRITYLAISDDWSGAADMRAHAERWGLRPIIEESGVRLYSIDERLLSGR